MLHDGNLRTPDDNEVPNHVIYTLLGDVAPRRIASFEINIHHTSLRTVNIDDSLIFLQCHVIVDIVDGLLQLPTVIL